MPSSLPPPPEDAQEPVKPCRAKARRKGFNGLARHVWHPELVGVPRYPKTPEAYAELQEKSRQHFAKLRAEGKLRQTRIGIPDGWGRKGHLVTAARAAARIEAKEIVTTMVKAGVLDENALANEALEFAITVVRARGDNGEDPDKPVYTIRDRMAAAKTVLEYTKAKPVTQTAVTLNKAEDFLSQFVTKSAE